MENLKDLYTDAILDHGRHPRCEGEPSRWRFRAEGFNPLCGDRISVYVCESEGILDAIGFTSDSCLISRASASLMSEVLAGRVQSEAESLSRDFTAAMRGEGDFKFDEDAAKELLAIRKFHTRVKCVTLPWLTLLAALKDSIPI